ncbi:carboxyl-terminal processing protease [Pedobacter sp. UYP30]|uniref:S41 family peptidase n=1 Tax=Pedobacter sp. UYP30 TaxID=1756400 RepID=UPI00339B2068
MTNKKRIIQNSALGILLVIVAFSTACKKNNNVDQPSTRDQLTKDSIYLYAQQIYLWNSSLPSFASFNPRKYPSNDALLYALTQIPINPQTGRSYEYVPNEARPKYSFIDDGTVASEIGGVAGDFGFSVFYASDNDLRIKYVYASSPAAGQDLKRGYQITQINDFTDINTSDASIKKVVDAIFGSAAKVTLTVKKPDGTSQNVVVNKATYNINPVLYTHTYTVGAKKVGYIVFNSFTDNSVPQLDAAFATFASNGVKELIVDLRYNGGGAVSTSAQFTNLIAPASQNGKVMFTYFFNKTMQDKKATILKNQQFRNSDGSIGNYFDSFDYSTSFNKETFTKRGTLEGITRVYFLVTGGTASASELLINNLKPVVDVKLIGRQTYGKPVGFFSVQIDKNDLYIPQFQTKNQLDQGDYFDGFTPDKIVNDDVTKEFGDPTEGMLSQALYYSQNGRFTSYVNDNGISSTSPMSRSKMADLTGKLDHSFKGMVDDRHPKFKK